MFGEIFFQFRFESIILSPYMLTSAVNHSQPFVEGERKCGVPALSDDRHAVAGPRLRHRPSHPRRYLYLLLILNLLNLREEIKPVSYGRTGRIGKKTY